MTVVQIQPVISVRYIELPQTSFVLETAVLQSRRFARLREESRLTPECFASLMTEASGVNITADDVLAYESGEKFAATWVLRAAIQAAHAPLIVGVTRLSEYLGAGAIAEKMKAAWGVAQEAPEAVMEAVKRGWRYRSRMALGASLVTVLSGVSLVLGMAFHSQARR